MPGELITNADIVIIGGGITGCAAAIFLQMEGFKVAVIEKSDLKQYKAGESLDPKCKRFFNLMGFPLKPHYATEYYGNISTWKDEQPFGSDFIFNPYGNGIAIDRKAFDEALLEFAIEKGVTVHRETEPTQIRHQGLRVEVAIKGKEGQARLIPANFILFATGRNLPTFQKEAKQQKSYFDQLIALTVIEDDPNCKPDKRLYIEALPNGWFYSNIIPGGKRVSSYFTDSDLLDKKIAPTDIIRTQMRNAVSDAYRRESPVHIADARTCWSRNQTGKRWLGVGETAYSIDPLSGQGILKNLDMAYFLAENLKAYFGQDKILADMYLSYNAHQFDEYLKEQKIIYNMKNMYNENIFWKRRSQGS